jgi:hypothetical protein
MRFGTVFNRLIVRRNDALIRTEQQVASMPRLSNGFYKKKQNAAGRMLLRICE